MKINFNKISQNKRYGYSRVSSREQAENSSLESHIGLDTRPSMQLTLRLRGPKNSNL